MNTTIDVLEKLWKATTPGEWEAETVQIRDERSAYESMKSDAGKSIFDTLNSEDCEIHHDDGCHYWDEIAVRNFSWIAYVHNAMPEVIAQHRALLAACVSMLKTCGGAEHWTGETNKSLLLIEAAVEAVVGVDELKRIKAEAMVAVGWEAAP